MVREPRRRISAAFLGRLPCHASPLGQACRPYPVGRLQGRVRAPGDKSISHRALMLGALALGETTVAACSRARTCWRTAAALRALGADVDARARGRPVAGARLRRRRRPRARRRARSRQLRHLGAAAHGHPGQPSLHQLPHRRCLAAAAGRCSGSSSRWPHGRALRRRARAAACRSPSSAPRLVPIDYRLPVASAQVKSAILLAGLNTAGETTVIEPEADARPHRAHAAPFRRRGARRRPARTAAASASPSVGWPELEAATSSCRAIPRRPPSPSSPPRSGRAATSRSRASASIRCAPASIETLREMGADIAFENEREVGGEPVADLHVRGGALKGVDVPAERAPSMIDEYPDPRRRRRLRQGHDAHAGPGRAARQGKRPAGQRLGRACRPTACRTSRGADLIVHGTGAAAGRRRPGRDPSRPPHRHVASWCWALPRASRWRSTTARRSTPASPASPRLMNGLGARSRPETT